MYARWNTDGKPTNWKATHGLLGQRNSCCQVFMKFKYEITSNSLKINWTNGLYTHLSIFQLGTI